MKNPGKLFEEDFMESFPCDMFTYRLRDSSGAWGDDNKELSNGKNRARFTPTNICDFVVHNYINHETLFLELKSTQQKSMSFTNLKKHQIKGLYKAGKYNGVKAFFIFNFRTFGETYAINAELINEFYEKAERKSFSIEWCREHGILIESKIKRTRLDYNIDKLLLN
jgi:recombination protein U